MEMFSREGGGVICSGFGGSEVPGCRCRCGFCCSGCWCSSRYALIVAAAERRMASCSFTDSQALVISPSVYRTGWVAFSSRRKATDEGHPRRDHSFSPPAPTTFWRFVDTSGGGSGSRRLGHLKPPPTELVVLRRLSDPCVFTMVFFVWEFCSDKEKEGRS